MRQRSRSGASRGAAVSVDVAVLSPRGRELAVLAVGDALPWGWLQRGEPSDDAARRIAADALGAQPRDLAQVGAVDGARHPGDADLSIGYVALVPAGDVDAATGARWVAVGQLSALAARHRLMAERAAASVRARMDLEPVAFQLLPPAFTLSDLQAVYELLLGRRLHKASFRRALAAAHLVEPLDEWRSEGRGRPAQLHRFAARRRRSSRRAVRFDMP